MSIVLDAGALLALERGDRHVEGELKKALSIGIDLVTHGGVVGQVWRGGTGRQVVVVRYLNQALVRPLNDDLGRRAGMLLWRTRMSDVVDAALVLLAASGDTIITSDLKDLRILARAAGVEVDFLAA